MLVVSLRVVNNYLVSSRERPVKSASLPVVVCRFKGQTKAGCDCREETQGCNKCIALCQAYNGAQFIRKSTKGSSCMKVVILVQTIS